MTQAKMDELKIFRGDAVILKGKSPCQIFWTRLWLRTASTSNDDKHRLMS